MNKNDTINKIKREILSLFREVLSKAINEKSNTSLENSHLSHDAEVHHMEQGESELFNLMYNDYLDYIEWRRPPRYKKKPPIRVLIPWAKERGLPSDNRTLWAISTSIWLVGWKARPIIAPFETLLDERWEKYWSDLIFETLTKEDSPICLINSITINYNDKEHKIINEMYVKYINVRPIAEDSPEILRYNDQMYVIYKLNEHRLY
mgnify:CR=1 FL=1